MPIPIKLDGTGQDLGTGRQLQSAAGNYGSLDDYAAVKSTDAATLTAAGWVFIEPYDGTGGLLKPKWDGNAWVEGADSSDTATYLAEYKVQTNRSIDRESSVTFFTALAATGDGWMSIIYKTIEHLFKGFEALDLINDRDAHPLPEFPPANRRDEQTITALVQVAGVATATCANHGYVVGEKIYVGGCDQADYNGEQIIDTVPTSGTFTFSVDSAAATPATGVLIVSQTKKHKILELEAAKRQISVSDMADAVQPLAQSQWDLLAAIASIRPVAKDAVDAAADLAAVDAIYAQFQTDIASLLA